MSFRFGRLVRQFVWVSVFAIVGCNADAGEGADEQAGTESITASESGGDTSADEDTTTGVDTTTTTDDTTTDTTTTDGTTSTTDDTTTETTGDGDGLDPPAGQSSGGNGGGAAAGTVEQAGNITYSLIAPGSGGPYPLMIVYSGVEGGAAMTSNILMVKEFVGAGNFVFAILDGVTYNGNGAAGATVLDAVRTLYDIDNDRTYLLSESAGTTAGLQLGLNLRQSWFAAYWANDINANAAPTLDAAQLGFQPYGNAGPGGDFADANAIVGAMQAADYRTPPPAPYDGPGAGTHGDPNQFIAAMQWFPGKTRQ